MTVLHVRLELFDLQRCLEEIEFGVHHLGGRFEHSFGVGVGLCAQEREREKKMKLKSNNNYQRYTKTEPQVTKKIPKILKQKQATEKKSN
jgi:hypothetical protein